MTPTSPPDAPAGGARPRFVRRLLSVACVLACVLGASSARAASTFDMRGTWVATTWLNGTQVNTQLLALTSGDQASGTYAGTTSLQTGSPHGTLSATVTGLSLTMTNPYTTVAYTATWTGTVSADGLSMQGAWTDTNGRQGTWTATRNALPPGSGGGGGGSAGGGGAGATRPSFLSFICNRGPNPGDTATCTVTVADAGPAPTTVPTGTVTFTAAAGAVLGGGTCRLAPTSGGAGCTVVYQPPPGHGIGVPYPLSATYSGDGVLADTAADHKTVGPNPGSLFGPIRTCVGNFIGACSGFVPPPDPIQVCVANAVGACTGFAAGAKLAGVWGDPSTGFTLDLTCPKAKTQAERRRRQMEEPPFPLPFPLPLPFPGQTGSVSGSGSNGTGSDCGVSVQVLHEARDIQKMADRVIGEYLRLRPRLRAEINAQPASVQRFAHRIKVKDVLSPGLLGDVWRYNDLVRGVDAVVSAFKEPGFTFRVPDRIDVDLTIHEARARRVFAATRTPSGPLAVGTRQGTLRSGARARTTVSLDRRGRAVVGLARKLGIGQLRMRVSITVTSPTLAFAPASATKTVIVRVPRTRKGARS